MFNSQLSFKRSTGAQTVPGTVSRVDSRSVDQVCTVINDVVKVKEIKHLRGKFNAFVFSERERLQQPQVNGLERAIAVCIALQGNAGSRIRPVRGRGAVAAGNDARDQKVSIAVKVRIRSRIDGKSASR